MEWNDSHLLESDPFLRCLLWTMNKAQASRHYKDNRRILIYFDDLDGKTCNLTNRNLIWTVWYFFCSDHCFIANFYMWIELISFPSLSSWLDDGAEITILDLIHSKNFSNDIRSALLNEIIFQHKHLSIFSRNILKSITNGLQINQWWS